MRAEPWTDPVCFHAEGPVWDAPAQALHWVDMLAGEVLTRSGSGGGIRRRKVGDVAAALRPRTGGGFVVAVERGIALIDPDGGLRRLPELWSDTSVRMNEGHCDPQGRFYCGTMATNEASGRGRLFRVDADLSVDVVLHGVTVSNGLVWSRDGATLYYVDSPTREVAAFAFDAERGQLTDRRTLLTIDSEEGVPDGMTIDTEGRLWVAINGAGAVHCYTTSGQHVETIEVDAAEVTSCTFGGDDLAQLFITTSRQGLAPGQDPLAGSVFTARPGATGPPVAPFAG